MGYIVFENDGEIDERSIRTFGLSAKNNDNAIGYFGTGLKYAIAILLREGMEIEILSGKTRYSFDKKVTDVRGQSFELITMNGHEMPFTTRLGIGWETWQAFREIYCNTVDEGGTVRFENNKPIDGHGKTIVIVKGECFENHYRNIDKIILRLDSGLIVSQGDVDAYDCEGTVLFYKGVKVADLPKTSMLTYNIKSHLELTEDRTVKYMSSALAKLPLAIAGIKDEYLIRRAILADDKRLESEFSYSVLSWNEEHCSSEFLSTLTKVFKGNYDRLNRSARDFHMKRIKKSAAKHYDPVEMTPVERKQLDRARAICSRMWKDFDDYRIMVVKNLGEETMALADINERTIVLSRRSFEMGTKFLVSTVIEEYMHLKTGYGDLTRPMQTYLFDTICTLIENHVLGEPI